MITRRGVIVQNTAAFAIFFGALALVGKVAGA